MFCAAKGSAKVDGTAGGSTKACLSCRLNWFHNNSSRLILHLFLSLNRKGTNDKSCYCCQVLTPRSITLANDCNSKR